MPEIDPGGVREGVEDAGTDSGEDAAGEAGLVTADGGAAQAKRMNMMPTRHSRDDPILMMPDIIMLSHATSIGRSSCCPMRTKQSGHRSMDELLLSISESNQTR
jgi:hypothetical protein